jgi:Protein of unknown function (DUF2934)
VTAGVGCYYFTTTSVRHPISGEGLDAQQPHFKESVTMKINRSASTPRQTSTTLAVMKSASELQDQIRRRAYELYEQRGSNDGHEVSDWLQAESELAPKKEANMPRTDRQHGAHLL